MTGAAAPLAPLARLAREHALLAVLAACAALLAFGAGRAAWRALASGLVAKELRQVFLSPLAWLTMAGFALVNGFVFVFLVEVYQGRPNEPLVRVFFGGNAYFWILQLVVIPAITMRLLAEERAQGTLEGLLTAPIGSGEIVAGKFIAACAFYAALWLPTWVLLGSAFDAAAPDGLWAELWARRGEAGFASMAFARLNAVMDLGPIAAAYLGVWLMGGAWLAVSLFASSFSRSQGLGFIAGFVALLALFAVGFLEALITADPGWLPGLGAALRHLSFPLAFDGFARGFIDTRAVVYFASLIALSLFLTARVLDSQRWR